MEIFDVEIGIITPAPDFYIKLALDYDKELKRFAKRMPELLDFYEKEFDKIFHGSLRILSLERGSLVALCKQTNTRNALETIVKLNRALPIMNKKGRKTSVAEIVYLEKGIQRRLTTENEFKAALYSLSLEDNFDVPQLTQPKEHENQEFSTHSGRPAPTLEVEDDLDRKFIAAMDINQFQRTDITAYPIGVQSFLETISAKVERGAPLNEFEEYERARYVQTRRAVHAWRKYLNLKPEERPPCPEQISTSVMLFWREQKRMAQVPLTPEDYLFLKKINEKNNTHMVNKGILEVVSFFKEHRLDAPNGELTLLSLLPPRDRCEIWRQLLPSFPASKVLYQKYALALMKDNRLEEATRVLDEGVSKHVLNNNERLECLTALQSVKMGIEVGNAPRPATSYQQTLQRLVTTFAAYKRLPFYQLLIDYCKRNGAQCYRH